MALALAMARAMDDESKQNSTNAKWKARGVVPLTSPYQDQRSINPATLNFIHVHLTFDSESSPPKLKF
jgi:hypothetical protein